MNKTLSREALMREIRDEEEPMTRGALIRQSPVWNDLDYTKITSVNQIKKIVSKS